MLVCFRAECADINWSLAGTASGSGGLTGTPSNVKDNNTTTSYGSFRFAPGASGCIATVDFIETASKITRAEVLYSGLGDSGQITVELLVDGSWTTVNDTAMTLSLPTKTTLTVTGTWRNVSSIRATLVVGSSSQSIVHNYETRAFGPENAKGNYIISFL